jgi:prephenate dehydrogenase
MKIALIGHGAMGQLVESQAQAAGDQIGAILTSRTSALAGPDEIDEMAASLKGHDVAIAPR